MAEVYFADLRARRRQDSLAAKVRRLVDLGIPLEVCPTSNLCTRVVSSYTEHPFPALDAAGVLVTINSDDPPLFGTTLTDEFLVLARHWGYDADGVQRIALNGLEASFLPEDDKARLRDEFLAEFATLRAELGLPPASEMAQRAGAAAVNNSR